MCHGGGCVLGGTGRAGVGVQGEPGHRNGDVEVQRIKNAEVKGVGVQGRREMGRGILRFKESGRREPGGQGCWREG